MCGVECVVCVCVMECGVYLPANLASYSVFSLVNSSILDCKYSGGGFNWNGRGMYTYVRSD